MTKYPIEQFKGKERFIWAPSWKGSAFGHFVPCVGTECHGGDSVQWIFTSRWMETEKASALTCCLRLLIYSVSVLNPCDTYCQSGFSPTVLIFAENTLRVSLTSLPGDSKYNQDDNEGCPLPLRHCFHTFMQYASRDRAALDESCVDGLSVQASLKWRVPSSLIFPMDVGT